MTARGVIIGFMNFYRWVSLVFWMMLLAACRPAVEAETAAPAVESPSPAAPTDTALPPTPTSVPLAARVNGEGITLAAYQAELARYRAAAGTELASEEEMQVLQSMVDELLLAQAAEQAGFVVDDDMLQERIAQLDIGEGELLDWMEEHSYTQESFEAALRRAIAAAWMRDQIIAQTPRAAEQVHARQILLYNSEDADAVLAQLQAGTDFATLAAQYDPLTGGDLGWFPRGYLLVGELDDPVFQLSAGEVSPVIESPIGYHVVQVIERDPARPLEPDAYRAAQLNTLAQWLADRRAQSEIEVLAP